MLPGFDLLWVALIAVGAGLGVLVIGAAIGTTMRSRGAHAGGPVVFLPVGGPPTGSMIYREELAWRQRYRVPPVGEGGWASGTCTDGPVTERWPAHEDPYWPGDAPGPAGSPLPHIPDPPHGSGSAPGAPAGPGPEYERTRFDEWLASEVRLALWSMDEDCRAFLARLGTRGALS